MGATTGMRRRRWPVIAQLALIVVALAAAAFCTFVTPSGVSQVERFTPATLGDQPAGAVVLGKEDGDLAVGLAVAPRKHGLLVGVTVFGQNGRGRTGLRPRLTITNRDGSRSWSFDCYFGCDDHRGEHVHGEGQCPQRGDGHLHQPNGCGFGNQQQRRGNSLCHAAGIQRNQAGVYHRTHDTDHGRRQCGDRTGGA